MLNDVTHRNGCNISNCNGEYDKSDEWRDNDVDKKVEKAQRNGTTWLAAKMRHHSDRCNAFAHMGTPRVEVGCELGHGQRLQASPDEGSQVRRDVVRRPEGLKVGSAGHTAFATTQPTVALPASAHSAMERYAPPPHTAHGCRSASLQHNCENLM